MSEINVMSSETSTKRESADSDSPQSSDKFDESKWRLVKPIHKNIPTAAIVTQLRLIFTIILTMISNGAKFSFKQGSLLINTSDDNVFVKLSSCGHALKFIPIGRASGFPISIDRLMSMSDDHLMELIMPQKYLTTNSPRQRVSEISNLKETTLILIKRLKEKLEIMDENEVINLMHQLTGIINQSRSLPPYASKD